MGRVVRSSISLAPEPGMETITSIIGTLICGSSSRGSNQTAATPRRTELMIISGVSFESIKAPAIRPAIPVCSVGLLMSQDLHSLSVHQLCDMVDDHFFIRFNS